MVSLSELTISEIHSAYIAGEYSARELVQAYFDRIKNLDENGPRLNSILTISPFAVNEADHLDAYLKLTGKLKGPLHGIPTIVKDQIETKGITTSFGSIAAKNHIPDQDATLISNLKRSGAIIIAKSTMPGKWTCCVTSKYANIICPIEIGLYHGSLHPLFPRLLAIHIVSLGTLVAPVQGPVLPSPRTLLSLVSAETLAVRSDCQVHFVTLLASGVLLV